MRQDAQRTTDGIVAWFGKNARDLPWRRTRDPYAIWISEVMLQQTQVKTVIPYWERWMRAFPTVRDLAEAEEERVLKLWEGLGYYRRARNLQQAARIIQRDHGGQVPREFDAVLALPGIGRYTAGAICSIAYGAATPILDGNVIRVLSRLWALSGDPKRVSNQKQLWELSARLVSAAARRGACSELNQGLMELGATLCTPREPACPRCPIQSQCEAFRTGRVHEFPALAVRAKAKQRRFIAFVFRRGESVLVRKRAAELVNGNLWEFPNLEVKSEKSAAAKHGAHLKLRHFATIKHTIMNNRITLCASTAEVQGEGMTLAREHLAEWRNVEELVALPFSSAHARLRALLLTGTEV